MDIGYVHGAGGAWPSAITVGLTNELSRVQGTMSLLRALACARALFSHLYGHLAGARAVGSPNFSIKSVDSD